MASVFDTTAWQCPRCKLHFAGENAPHDCIGDTGGRYPRTCPYCDFVITSPVMEAHVRGAHEARPFA